MSKFDIIRAWKDEEFRRSLTDAQREALPQNPAGLVELFAADLEEVVGGAPPSPRPAPPKSRRYSCTPRLCC